ncbi:MAG TPA: hypothetical protein VD794_00975 [Flavisolibacter sp.]|nr:hypothetical protein [Flavisolibacter sp.]
MLRKKLFIPLLIFFVVATIISAIVHADGNITSLIAFLIIAFFIIAVQIPTKNQK